MDRTFPPLLLAASLALFGSAAAQEPAPAPAASARLELLELRDVPLDDALRLIAAESDLNVVASRAAARTRVTLLLRDVEPVAALSTLCSSHDLWFERDAATAVYRIRTASEYQRGVQNLASAKLEVFTLLYPNALDVAYSIRDLFGQRVRFGRGINPQDRLQELSNRFQRFDLVDGRSQGFGQLQGQQTNTQLNQAGQLGNLFNQNGQFGNQLGNQNLFNQQNQQGGRTQVDQADLGRDRLQGLTAQQIQALVSASDSEAGRALVDRILSQASIYVSVNQRTNQVLVRTGDEQAMSQIRDLIKRMDVPTPLVLLEVKVLSIELTDGFNSVFDYQFSDGSSSAAGFTTGDVLPPPSDVVGGPDSLRRTLPLSPAGGGLIPDNLIYQFVHDHFRARVQLLESQGRVTTLATPLLLTANNEVSRLFAGEERPINRSFIGGQTVVNAGGTTVTPSTTGIEFRPVGTTLLITPNINADRTVTLRILQETSNVNVNGASVLVPNGTGFIRQNVDTVQSRAVSGTVVAKHGATLALGGLIEEELRDARDGVPWLQRIPLLGFFFRRQDYQKVRRELVITIRPFVLTTPGEGDTLSRRLMKELSIHPNAPDARGTLSTFDESDVIVPGDPNTVGELLEVFDLHGIGKEEKK
ncbi:MAG TPA: hypothetical protein DEA08_20025 [Planctomycetes bacterium]|nr:hypothetical protein [Planctomycetota bacterium]